MRRSRGHVDIAVHSGEGRIWTPEPVDASWRSFAALELHSEKDCVAFVQRRGDPLEIRPTPFHINTAQWIFLKKALLLASALWGDPDKNGVSYPLDQTGWRAGVLRRPLRHVDGEKPKHCAAPERRRSCGCSADAGGLPDRPGRACHRETNAGAPLSALRLLVRDSPHLARAALLFGVVPHTEPSTSRRRLRNMASVRKSPTAKGTLRWQAVWAERADGGRTQRRTKNFDTQKEAREHAQRMEVEVERRGIGDPQKHSVERYLKRWLATLTERGELSPTTLAAYRWQADIACRHIGHILLEKLSPADIDQLYSILLRRGGITRRLNADGTKGTRPLTARTVLNVHRVISNALGAGAPMEDDCRESGQGCACADAAPPARQILHGGRGATPARRGG